MSITDHYESWAGKNSGSWVLSPEYISFWTKQIVRHGQLAASQSLCDLGAGNGLLARSIQDQVGLRITCVEPSAASVQEILARGLEVSQLTGEEFCATAPAASFDRLLIKQAIHHMRGNPADLFAHFKRILRPGGLGLILTMPETILYPMFQAAIAQVESKQIDRGKLQEDLKKAGFQVEETYADFPVSITRENLAYAIKNRFISDLAGFSPAELEAGIQEIEETHQHPARYNFSDRLYIIIFRL